MSIKAVLCVIAVSARQPIAKQWYHLSLQFRKVHSVTCMCNQEPIVWSLRYLQPQASAWDPAPTKSCANKGQQKSLCFHGTNRARDLCTCDSVAQQERLRWLRENCSWYSSCCSRSCQLPVMPASFRKVLKKHSISLSLSLSLPITWPTETVQFIHDSTWNWQIWDVNQTKQYILGGIYSAFKISGTVRSCEVVLESSIERARNFNLLLLLLCAAD